MDSSQVAKRMNCAVRALAVGASCLFFAVGASSQERVVEGEFSVQRFSAPAGPRNFIMTRGVRTDGENAISAGLVLNYAQEPFTIAVASRAEDTKVVQNLAAGDLLFSYTPMPLIQLGVRLPITFVQGQNVNPFTGAPADVDIVTLAGGTPTDSDVEPIETVGLADPELEVKGRFYGRPDDPFLVGGSVFVTAPLGEATAEGTYIGDGGVTGGARVIADGRAGPAAFGLNLGYRFRPDGRIGSTDIGSEAVYSVAAALTVGPVVRVVADAHGATQFSNAPGTNSLELLGGIQLTPIGSGISVTAAGGAGLIQGALGVPNFRAVLGFSYIAETKDPDGDGVADPADLCPLDPEDLDGFEDSDGCPDVDNDNDALPDVSDKCPGEPEDLDGFEDADGCPDEDNDKDGIKDNQDKCPAEPENKNGFEDDDGCPDTPDTDKDGVADPDDKCPSEPEDTDGFEDTDGCPDLDNDGDGFNDDVDECVDEPEDGKGDDVEQKDGCPFDA